MSVRAKFYVRSVEMYAADNGKVNLSPATRGADNASWASATPSGMVELTINNPAAFGWFAGLLGKEVFIDFTVADPDLINPAKHAFEAFVNPSHYLNGKCRFCSMAQEAHS